MNDHFRRSRREVGLEAAERIVKRDEYPKGLVTVAIRELSITLEEDLQVEWTP